MRLIDLRPRWLAEEGRYGQGIIFDCPCCRGTERAVRLAVIFQPALDGGEPLPPGKIGRQFRAIVDTLRDEEPDPYRNVAPSGIVWQRVGDTFETLTLSPSINYAGADHWHGCIANGDAS